MDKIVHKTQRQHTRQAFQRISPYQPVFDANVFQENAPSFLLLFARITGQSIHFPQLAFDGFGAGADKLVECG